MSPASYLSTQRHATQVGAVKELAGHGAGSNSNSASPGEGLNTTIGTTIGKEAMVVPFEVTFDTRTAMLGRAKGVAADAAGAVRSWVGGGSEAAKIAKLKVMIGHHHQPPHALSHHPTTQLPIHFTTPPGEARPRPGG